MDAYEVIVETHLAGGLPASEQFSPPDRRLLAVLTGSRRCGWLRRGEVR